MKNLILGVQPLAFLFPGLKYVCLNSEKLLCLLDSMLPHILNIKAAAPNSCPILSFGVLCPTKALHVPLPVRGLLTWMERKK